MNETDKILIFVHIPKTAGTTLNDILDNQFTLQEKIDYYSDYDIFVKNIKNNDYLKCINGHFRFGIHEHLQKPFSYVTMLRHPIERVISTYYYIRRSPDHPIHTMVKNMSIEDFVTSKEMGANYLVFNMQTTYVSGKYPPDLEEAKKNLEQYFDIVGITEMFDQSLFLMKKAFGWKSIGYKPANVTKNRPNINQHSKEVIDLITQKNQLDLELYEFAKQLFNKKIENLDPETKTEMNKFLGNKDEK